MQLARWLHAKDIDYPTTRNPMLYDHGDVWGNALAGLTTLAAEAQRESTLFAAGLIDPFGQAVVQDERSGENNSAAAVQAGGRAWDFQSRAPYELFMPVTVRYFLRPDQIAPRAVPQIGPYDLTEQRAAALQQALVADMLAARQQ